MTDTATGRVGPIVFSNERARRQLKQLGEVVTFRTAERTTGETWWRASRTGPKRGDCTVEHLGVIQPRDRTALKSYRTKSGFRSVADWQDAIRDLNGELAEGHLYRVTSEDRWAECESCDTYSPDVFAIRTAIDDYVVLCPDCRDPGF